MGGSPKVKLSTRETALFSLLLVLGCLFLSNRFIFQPLTQHKQQLISENNNLTAELRVIQDKISKYRFMQQDELKTRDDYQRMLEAVPQSPMIASIIDCLELSAQEANVKLVSIHYKENALGDPAPQTAKAGSDLTQVMPVSFQIVASGSQYDLLSFILTIENASRIFIINSSKISLAMKDQSPTGITPPLSNLEPAENEKAIEGAVPESAMFDQGKSLLSLDFNAYYHSSLVSEAAQP
jgi:hypothetical protein